MIRVVALLLVLAVCPLFSGSPSSLHAAPPAESKSPHEGAIQIAEALLKPFDSQPEPEELSVREAFQKLQDHLGRTIVLDAKGLFPNPEGELAVHLKDLESRKIVIPVLKKVRLETALKSVCDQIGADYVIEADHLRITSSAVKDFLIGESNPITQIPVEGEQEKLAYSREERMRLTPLVTIKFEQVPLRDAVRKLADRSGRNLILSASATDAAESQVSLSTANGASISLALTNVSFETAALALAESAGLRAIKQGNVVTLVSEERYATLTARLHQTPVANLEIEALRAEAETLKKDKAALENKLKEAGKKTKKSKK